MSCNYIIPTAGSRAVPCNDHIGSFAAKFLNIKTGFATKWILVLSLPNNNNNNKTKTFHFQKFLDFGIADKWWTYSKSVPLKDPLKDVETEEEELPIIWLEIEVENF